MRFNISDDFVRFMALKAQGGWSTTEVLEIFKYRYGESYDNALANFLMDSLGSTPKMRKTKKDKEYAKMWKNALDA